VAFRLTVDGRLPFADEEVDAACCVSVVEHVEDQTRLLEELARILIRGGILVLTVDLGLRDGEALSVEGFNGLRRALESSFDLAVPERTIHPRDTLTPDRGPYGTGGQTFAQRLTSSVRDGVTFLRHGRVYRLRPRSLCVAGFVYRKR
jgi:SAM-dependent methyltransferase